MLDYLLHILRQQSRLTGYGQLLVFECLLLIQLSLLFFGCSKDKRKKRTEMPNSARSLVTPVGVPTPIGESAQSRLSGATPKKTPSMPTPGSNTKEITQSTSSGRKKQGKDKNQRAKSKGRTKTAKDLRTTDTVKDLSDFEDYTQLQTGEFQQKGQEKTQRALQKLKLKFTKKEESMKGESADDFGEDDIFKDLDDAPIRRTERTVTVANTAVDTIPFHSDKTQRSNSRSTSKKKTKKDSDKTQTSIQLNLASPKKKKESDKTQSIQLNLASPKKKKENDKTQSHQLNSTSPRKNNAANSTKTSTHTVNRTQST